MANPFSLTFGREPEEYIIRPTQTEEIISTFTSEKPLTQAYIIAGVRGSGKTVMLSNIAHTIEKRKDWIVVELNPNQDMLQSLAAKLYSEPSCRALFLKAKLDFSVLGLGLSIEGGLPIVDVETAISSMLELIKKKKKRVLLCVDEAANVPSMRVFASAFQIFIRQELPLFLLMTGLYENINSLQDDKTLTFLYRTPRVVIEALNLTAIARKYQTIFSIPIETARAMAQLTKGYAFAFQVLGYLTWEKKDEYQPAEKYDAYLEDILPRYDHHLQDYVYEKIWKELSAMERRIVVSLADEEKKKVQAIRNEIQSDSNNFTVYRDRLIKKGVLVSPEYGYLALSLPRFGVYARLMEY